MTHSVVIGAFCLVGENLVGFPHDGELRCCSVVVVNVWMVLTCHLTEGLFDVGLVGVAFNVEKLIEVHRHSTWGTT